MEVIQAGSQIKKQKDITTVRAQLLLFATFPIPLISQWSLPLRSYMMIKSLKIPAEVVLGCFLQLIQKLKNPHLLLFFWANSYSLICCLSICLKKQHGLYCLCCNASVQGKLKILTLFIILLKHLQKTVMMRHLFEIVITIKHLDGWNIIAGSPKAADRWEPLSISSIFCCLKKNFPQTFVQGDLLYITWYSMYKTIHLYNSTFLRIRILVCM